MAAACGASDSPFSLRCSHNNLPRQMGAFSSRISRIMNGGDGLEALWIVGQPSPTPAMAPTQEVKGERGAGGVKDLDLQRDDDGN